MLLLTKEIGSNKSVEHIGSVVIMETPLGNTTELTKVANLLLHR